MEIPIAAADWCFWRKGAEPGAYYRGLRAAGVDAAEMVPPERLADARAAGLKVLTASGPGMDSGLGRQENHSLLLPQIEAAIAEAGPNQIPMLILFAGQRQGERHQDGIAACASALLHLAPLATAAGVRLLLEFLNSYDHRDHAFDHTPYGVAVVERVCSPAVKLLYDIYHAARMGMNIEHDLGAHAALIGHIHVAEPPMRDEIRPDSPLAWPKLVRLAADAGYRGHWGLEFKTEGDPISAIQRAAALLRAR